jgi:hypothetical protein
VTNRAGRQSPRAHAADDTDHLRGSVGTSLWPISSREPKPVIELPVPGAATEATAAGSTEAAIEAEGSPPAFRLTAPEPKKPRKKKPRKKKRAHEARAPPAGVTSSTLRERPPVRGKPSI